MNRTDWHRLCIQTSLCLSLALVAGVVNAADGEDTLSLKIASALRSDRLFMRAGAIYVKVKTKAGDTYDVTGPVIKTTELDNVFFNNTDENDINLADAQLTQILTKYPQGTFTNTLGRDIDALYELFSRNGGSAPVGDLLDQRFGIPLVTDYLKSQGLSGIGTPPGITGVAAPESGTAGISMGYFLDDDHKWVVETYVLAAPLNTSVAISGSAPVIGAQNQVVTDSSGNVLKRPISIDGAKIITSKILPPTLMFGRYWGDKNAKFRPYTGAMAMYAIFLDTKATDTLNSYVGGSNPGDTTVSLKNSFGLGPVVGMKYQFNDTWHASLNVGHVKLKTQATITTRNTYIGSGATILRDLGEITARINTGEIAYNPNICLLTELACQVVGNNGGLVTLITKGVIADRLANGEGDGKTLGTYVRKSDTTLTNTVFMMSVGRSF